MCDTFSLLTKATRTPSGFIGDKAIARARIKNSIVQLAGYSDWYVQFLTETVRPAIADAITAIETYQNQA
jgi:hypothetical protein